jgi:ribosomal protein S18 acetylase RimI-like enzyme
MKNYPSMQIREVHPADRRQIDILIQTGIYVHRHFDWYEPLELIGQQPFYVAEWKYRLMAALACPTDLDGVIWIRFFAVVADVSVNDAWSILWAKACEHLHIDNLVVAAIPTQDWFQKLLINEQFEHEFDVISLVWEGKSLPISHKTHLFRIRNMGNRDLAEVRKVDEAAFELIWRNSQDSLGTALSKSAIATVAESPNGIIGYQISTASSLGGHLARLAVLPDWQGFGVGYSLVCKLLEQFHLWGTMRVTVNTQTHNTPSLALYKKVGFIPTDEVYPVLQRRYPLEMRKK